MYASVFSGTVLADRVATGGRIPESRWLQFTMVAAGRTLAENPEQFIGNEQFHIVPAKPLSEDGKLAGFAGSRAPALVVLDSASMVEFGYSDTTMKRAQELGPSVGGVSTPSSRDERSALLCG